MDNPVDNPIDLGLVNYTKHPTNNNYVVYRFADEKRAASFAQELEAAGIDFEMDHLEKKTVTYTLFGIHKNDFKKTVKINYLVEAKHKKRLIPVAGLRWFLIIISTAAMTLAIMGYCKQQNKGSSINNSTVSQDSSASIDTNLE